MPSTPKAPPAQPTGTEYRYMGDHATEMPMMDGTLPWLAPGDIVTLGDVDATSEKAVHLINEGLLVDTSTIGAEDEATPTEEVTAEATTENKEGGK